MSRRLLIYLLMPILLLSSGCWDRRELNQTVVATAMGIDSLKQDEIMATAQLATSQQPGTEKKETPAFVTVSESDKMFSTAFRKIMLKNPRIILRQHAAVMVFGDSMVQKGLLGFVDELARSRLIRETADLFIARNTRAADVLSVPTEIEKIPAMALLSMIRIQDSEIGIYSPITMSEFVTKTATPGIEPAVPGITIVESHDGRYLELSGTGVFKKGRLVGWLNEEESQGYRWLRPKMVQGGIKTVRCPICHQPVVIQTIRAQSQIKPEIKNGEIKMKIKVTEEGLFYEQRCSHRLVTIEGLQQLNQASQQLIKTQIKMATKKAQRLDSDIFGFGLAIKKQHPEQWAQIEDHWDEIFPTIKTDIQVDSLIRRTNLRRNTTTIRY